MAMRYSSQFSLSRLRQNLFSRQYRVNGSMHMVTKAGAEEIMKKSQSNAPVDTHNLEEAHHIDTSFTKADNVRFQIEVSGVGSGSDRPRDVADYAMEMHEHLAPYGSGEYNLGPDSIAKAAAGNDVGGKYLERAVESLKAEIIADMRRAIRESM